MGGGGGGGQQNNSAATPGGNGGGIILIKANSLTTSSICSTPIKINANGQSAANGGNDGAGGGGAGGSILFQVGSFSVTSTCTLGITANGGNGGNCTDGGQHAGGGGGGQGVVIYSLMQPTVNAVTTTTNGIGGRDYSGGPTTAGSGSGVVNSGILTSLSSPLPIELIRFDGTVNSDAVLLNWVTASEVNNNFYTVERSSDAIDFNEIGIVKANNTMYKSTYNLWDNSPIKGINYYRLKQTDFDGSFTYSQIVGVEFNNDIRVVLHPNPIKKNETLIISFDKEYNSIINLEIVDAIGKKIYISEINLLNNTELF